MRDYYEILNIHRGASLEEIKKAYRQLAMKVSEARATRGSPDNQISSVPSAIFLKASLAVEHAHAGRQNEGPIYNAI